MNQEFAKSLDLKETLNNSLDLIIKRINAQAANIFLIDKKKSIIPMYSFKTSSLSRRF